MDKALAELIEISYVTGKDKNLVLGGGGNTSVKTDDGQYMYIKASGTALKDMDEERGWRRLRLERVTRIIRDGNMKQLDDEPRERAVVRNLLLACEDETTSGARPSVESPLHALLDRYVIHLHPEVVSGIVNARNGRLAMQKLFGNEKFPPLWVPYTNPGFWLAARMARLVADYRKQFGCQPGIMFLEKHGLFVAADSAKNALSLVRRVIRRCHTIVPAVQTRKFKPHDPAEIQAAQLAIRRALFETTGQFNLVRYVMDETIAAFLARQDARALLDAGALSPDEIAYAHGPAMWLEKADLKTIVKKIQKQLDHHYHPAAAFLIKNLGLFIAAEPRVMDTIEGIAISSLAIRGSVPRLGGINTLTKRQYGFIAKWEGESYRMKLAAGAHTGDLKHRIAVVTGAGSGLGRSIAAGLARAGAMVAVCDIDTAAAEETVRGIQNEIPGALALTVPCNVTDETSVDAAFGNLMEQWGGLDIVVNAAGVAPAYPLVDLPVAKWRMALEVNLTGYFLMARAAARIMILQGMGGNIINLSSKSGLDASKNNTPYNATKAGELHMARGWAMELGPYGIRVNCVCPGNVFEGSKIWNPGYIQECAKKYGIKPEEVIPFYVDKTILKREIKGQDIADAVVFLCSDRARVITGQTLVADSGQVMVR